ncbi:CRISPR-associated endonuclease Cas3'' [Stackebrandtia nassauensis]|uniref:RNA helicase n=1 Tax=Stackebrandtia nassauensis (strain DSM 44728 / CIP 108903 / NRRL B-16338 / NBRC 102104 / LLR-40K-21) TaxID=446470 RepID=D3PWM1_STANL|nr:CRISPR-associated endonuclease Cas3'' [Stackebrandtia nassauensis]ADD43243.1 CRISPR-associated helicase Cas3 [Stackebrandtia nassauensis DSM 44728]
MELFGHSANRGGDRQLLEDHLRGVAVLARRFAGEFGVGDLGYLTGLWHDAGKASCAWQDGLVRAEASGGPVGVDHKTLGCELAAEHGLQALGLVLHGHHGGLTSPGFVADALKNLSEAQRRNNAEARRGLTDLLAETGWARDVVLPWAKPLVAEMGLRLVFSALCDADSLDTAMHREGLAAPLVARDADVGLLWDRFQQRREDLLRHRPMSAVNVARQALFDECLRAAGKPRGMFRIPAATGLGKTINAGAFAMRHAAIHGMRRVVVAVPWLTITEQNAAVYRGLLDEGDEQVVLEHHSGVDFDVLPDCRRWERLASENWDAPFVVTTTVRLFESLFGRKREATRRLHRLSNAVVVLDEVQGLPYRLLLPILDGLRTLVDHFGASVVLCSATQPDFWNLGPFQGMEACDIVVPQELTRAVDGRVRYEWWTDPQPMLSDVADRACADESALVVVNTTKDASAVVDRWRELAGDSLVYHLSTRMCPAHRRYVLAAVRSGLAAGTPVLLVSTQLIEAGVDVDFAVVYRALAPADSLVQAGGRANREGRLPDGGRVVIFDPLDGGAPPTYRTLVGNTRRFFGPDKSAPDDTTAQLRYWRAVYDDTGVEGRGSIGRQIQSARQRLDYQSVTDGPQDLETGARDSKLAFRMISDDSVAVICPQWVGNGDGRGTGEKNLVSNEFNPRVLELIDQVRSGIGIGSAMRQLQPFTTNLHISAVRKPGVTALLAPLLGDVDTPGSLAVWQGDYDVTTGIALDPEMERFVL